MTLWVFNLEFENHSRKGVRIEIRIAVAAASLLNHSRKGVRIEIPDVEK